jgi:hypothetical protein
MLRTDNQFFLMQVSNLSGDTFNNADLLNMMEENWCNTTWNLDWNC